MWERFVGQSFGQLGQVEEDLFGEAEETLSFLSTMYQAKLKKVPISIDAERAVASINHEAKNIFP